MISAAGDRRLPVSSSIADDPAVDLTPARLLWHALGSRRRDLVAASTLYSLHQLGESMVPVIIGATVSKAIAGGSWPVLTAWLLLLAADFAVLSMAYRFGARASMRAKQHTAHHVRMSLAQRIFDPAGGIQQPAGDLLSRASSDAGRVGAFAGILASTIAAVVVLITSTLMLLRFSVPLGVIIIAGTVGLLAVQRHVSGVLQRRSTAEQRELARATVLAEDLIRGLRVLRGIGAERQAATEYVHASQSAVRAALHATSAQATLSTVSSVLTGVYLVLIVSVGGWFALSGRLGLGELIAALGLAQFVIGPMKGLAGASAAYARALASASRIREVIISRVAVESERSTEDTPRASADHRADLSVSIPPALGTRQNLGPLATPHTRPVGGPPTTPSDALIPQAAKAFSPEGGPDHDPATPRTGSAASVAHSNQRESIQFIGVRLAAGTIPVDLTLAMRGMTGIVCTDPQLAADVSLLLTRERDPESGQILLRNKDIRGLSLDSLRTQILVSPHDAVLLSGTIADNLNALTTDADAIAQAAWAASADQVIDVVPSGSATFVGDHGEFLSGGQRQRVALARAVAARPAVLVLHDPTTGVDAATEVRIADRIHQIRGSHPTLVISTSPAWLSRCEQVIFIAREVCGVDTHDHLLVANADYRQLVTR